MTRVVILWTILLLISSGAVVVVTHGAGPQRAEGGDRRDHASRTNRDQRAAPASNAASRPAEVRRGVELSGDREQRRREMWDAVVRKVEPSGRGDPSRIAQYLQFFRREFVGDTRIFAVDVKPETTPGG